MGKEQEKEDVRLIEVDDFDQNYASLDGKEERKQNIILENNSQETKITYLKNVYTALEETNDSSMTFVELTQEDVVEKNNLLIEEEIVILEEELIPETLVEFENENNDTEIDLKGEIVENVSEEICFSTMQEENGSDEENITICENLVPENVIVVPEEEFVIAVSEENVEKILGDAEVNEDSSQENQVVNIDDSEIPEALANLEGYDDIEIERLDEEYEIYNVTLTYQEVLSDGSEVTRSINFAY